MALEQPGTRSLTPFGFWECHRHGEQLMVVTAIDHVQLVEALELALAAARVELANMIADGRYSEETR